MDSIFFLFHKKIHVNLRKKNILLLLFLRFTFLQIKGRFWILGPQAWIIFKNNDK